MSKKIVVVGLFDGPSCGRIALDRTDIEVLRYYSSEIDKYAIQVADKNYPQDTKYRLGDVTKVDGVALREEIERDFGDVDVMLIGGSPCQGFSLSGKLKGSSTKCGKEVTTLNQYITLKEMGFEFDGQSYLFWEYIRIRDELNPKYFMLENVKITKKWLPMFNEATGVEPILINSALVSAQNRQRYYWINWSVEQPQDKCIYFQDIQESIDLRPVKPFVFGKYGDKNRVEKGDIKKLSVKKSNCLTTKNCHTAGYYLSDDLKKMRTLSAIEYERLQTIPDNYTDCVSNTQRYKMLGNGWTVDVVAHIFRGLENEL